MMETNDYKIDAPTLQPPVHKHFLNAHNALEAVFIQAACQLLNLEYTLSAAVNNKIVTLRFLFDYEAPNLEKRIDDRYGRLRHQYHNDKALRKKFAPHIETYSKMFYEISTTDYNERIRSN